MNIVVEDVSEENGFGQKENVHSELYIESTEFEFKDRIKCISSCDISPDETKVVTVSNNKLIQVLDLTTGECSIVINHKQTLRSCGYNPNGKCFSVGDSKGLIQVYTPEGELIHALRGHTSWVYKLVYTPEGDFLISCSQDKTLRIWDWVKGEEKFCLGDSETPLNCCCISRDGTTLAAGGDKGSLFVWKLQEELGNEEKSDSSSSSQEEEEEEEEESVEERKQMERPKNNKVWVLQNKWNVFTGIWACSCEFTRDGKYLVIGTGAYGRSDNFLFVVDPNTGSIIHKYKRHEWDVWGLTVCPTSDVVVTASCDGDVKLWYLFGKKKGTSAVLTRHSGFYGAWSARFSRSGRRLVTSGDDGVVKVFIMKTPLPGSEEKQETKFHRSASQSSYEELEKKAGEAEEKVMRLMQDLQREKVDAKQEINRLKEENQKLTSKLFRKEKEVNELKKEIEKYKIDKRLLDLRTYDESEYQL